MKGELLNILSPYRNKEKVLLQNQEVTDIMKGILVTHNLYKKEYDKIQHRFNYGNEFSIGKNLWNFLKQHVPYKIESERKQTLRSPSAILSMLGGADCKSYALFIGGVLDAISRAGKPINWAYRFSSYRFYEPQPQHVFVVINPGTDKEIWVDPVLGSYNERKQYYYHKDKTPMALVAIAGVNQVGLFGSKKRKAAKAAAAQTSEPGTTPAPAKKKKNIFQKAGDVLKKGGKVVLKVGAAPSRNAFLLLVKLNVFGLATKLQKAFTKDADKVTRFWSSAGGNANTLLKNVEQGAKKKRILGSVAIGEPATATAIAAATPLLVKIATLLKSIGIDPQDIKKIALDKAKDIAQNQLEKIAAKGNSIDQMEENRLEQVEEELGVKQPGQASSTPGAGMDMKKVLPIALAAGVGIYLLTRKK